MNIGFAYAGLAGALALVALPLLIHLVARRRARHLPFPGVPFLRRVVRRSMQARRPREWLLLAVRTLLFLALGRFPPAERKGVSDVF